MSFELAELEYCVFRDRSFYQTVSEVLLLEDDEAAYRDALTLEIRLL